MKISKILQRVVKEQDKHSLAGKKTARPKNTKEFSCLIDKKQYNNT